MDNASLLRTLTERAARNRVKDESGDRSLAKYVVFMIGERSYALPADRVREISFDNELYYVPFLPSYVRGYANRHGQPFTVLDLRMLFEKSALDSSTLLILNIDNDQLALLITDVDEIVKLPAGAVHPLASEEESARYFAHSITVEEREVFVIDVGTLLQRLERDVERI
ncbi:MAG TPA: chemotaxis protein CheW [Rectinemataceae bacterium]|nr:chemotaxis protein CheW [Rectinemataceae bacterium]